MQELVELYFAQARAEAAAGTAPLGRGDAQTAWVTWQACGRLSAATRQRLREWAAIAVLEATDADRPARRSDLRLLQDWLAVR